MQKFLKYAFLLTAAASLSACAFVPKQNSNSTTGGEEKQIKKDVSSNGQVEVKIKSGEFILPQEGSSDSKYLALSLEFKNKTNKKLMISNTDISLYNSEDEKVEPERVYSDSDKFKTLSYNDLAKGKTISGYVVFEVDKDQKYELHYSPTSYTTEDEVKEVYLKVDPSKYTDDVDEVKNVASEYVNAVFLGGEASGKDAKKSDKKKDEVPLGNDLEKSKTEFRTKFAETFKRRLYNYPFTEEETNAFIDAYVKANAKRANITYTVKEYFPDHAVVVVQPEVIGLKGITRDYLSNFYNQHRSEYGSLSDAYKAADKSLVDETMASLDSRPLATSESISREGYKMKLVRKDGKWIVETQDYGYGSFMTVFMGDF